MTEHFAQGISMPYGDGHRLEMTSKQIGNGQFMVTLAGSPIAAFVFASARDDAGSPPTEIAERLAIEYGVPVYDAIERFNLGDFARGVHALLEKAEHEYANATDPAVDMKPIRIYDDLINAEQDMIHISDAIRLIIHVESADMWPIITRLKAIHENLFVTARQFTEAHRTESLADGFPTVEFPVAGAEDL